jgi:hypothetical protein
MIEFFKSILNAITTAFDMLSYLVTGLVQLFAMIPSGFAMLTYSIGFLPTVLLAFASVAITLSIVYLIIGR